MHRWKENILVFLYCKWVTYQEDACVCSYMPSNALESQCLDNLETQLHKNEIGGMIVQSTLKVWTTKNLLPKCQVSLLTWFENVNVLRHTSECCAIFGCLDTVWKASHQDLPREVLMRGIHWEFKFEDSNSIPCTSTIFKGVSFKILFLPRIFTRVQ